MKGARAFGLLAALLMAAVFALAGGCAVVLTRDYGLRLDMTEQRLYTLSETTQAVLDALEADVQITVLNTRAECPAATANLLDSYALAGKRLEVRYIDPYVHPQTVQALAQQGVHVELNDLIVQSGGRLRQLKLTDLYELNADGTQVVRMPAEQRITSAIDAVTGEERALVLLTDGHGEAPTDSLLELLETNRFETAYAALSVLGIDERAQMVVICAPRRDFTQEEIAMLEAYLLSGGSVMALLEPGTQALTNLSAFLEDWGVGLTADVVREPKLHVSGSELNIAAGYASHPINSYFANNRYYVIMPSCMALEQLYVRQGTTVTRQVLVSTGSASALPEGELGVARQGPFTLAITSERTATTAAGETTGRLFVVGSRMMIGDDLMSSSSTANRDFIAQAAGWCMGGERLLSIPAAQMNGRFLPITAGDAYAVAAVMLGVLPALILLAGAVFWLRRRLL